MINEGQEPENFFWVGIAGKKAYPKVPYSLLIKINDVNAL